MNLVKIIIVGVVLFGISGVLAYLVDSIMLRYFGTIGRYESLLEYFKKIDQKNGNKPYENPMFFHFLDQSLHASHSSYVRD